MARWFKLTDGLGSTATKSFRSPGCSQQRASRSLCALRAREDPSRGRRLFAHRAVFARRYHRLYPFHVLLHGGKCTKGQVQAWALNRYYYEAIPLKDANLIALSAHGIASSGGCFRWR
jgi:TENA/THI-4/PQQC family